MALKLKNDAELNGWTFEPAFKENLNVCGIPIYGVGLSANHPEFGEMIGAAASIGDSPDDRAYFELCERITIIENIKKGPDSCFEIRDLEGVSRSLRRASDVFGKEVFEHPPESKFQLSKSNGIALHDSWEDACYGAAKEALERHHILNSWLGRVKPKLIDHPRESGLANLKDLYEVSYYLLGHSTVETLDESFFTVVAYFKPKSEKIDEIPVLYAFACEKTLDLAIRKAELELTQRLCFLWDEEIPKKEPDFMANPYYHQEFYLLPKNINILDFWLEGSFGGSEVYANKECISFEFAELRSDSFPQYYIAKALSDQTIDLFFGVKDDDVWGKLNDLQKIHPIP